jgi:hypothetical protein
MPGVSPDFGTELAVSPACGAGLFVLIVAMAGTEATSAPVTVSGGCGQASARAQVERRSSAVMRRA